MLSAAPHSSTKRITKAVPRALKRPHSHEDDDDDISIAQSASHHKKRVGQSSAGQRQDLVRVQDARHRAQDKEISDAKGDKNQDLGAVQSVSASSWSPPPEWRIGMARYRRTRDRNVLGEGGFATVERVLDLVTRNDRARKRQTHGDFPSPQLLSEVRILSQLQGHRGIVELTDVCHRTGKIDLIMPVYWGSLQDLLDARNGALDADTARNLSLQLIVAVSYIHRKGFAHLDLKPDNIMLFHEGCLKIADFGLSAEAGIDEDAQTAGTIGYSAPECLMGFKRPTFQSDVWSTGCVIAEMLLGRPLFLYSSTEVAMKDILRFLGHTGGIVFPNRTFTAESTIPIKWNAIRSDSSRRLRAMPPHASDLVKEMLQLDPMRRPQSKVEHGAPRSAPYSGTPTPPRSAGNLPVKF
ncbi:hypothetical protein A4X09_0g4572 [Tilletia walkeri]|uniref:Protein kinase domain-containing protein n=1 Tax=Tilletia walkeri TaxID=117179 RepID=A0A8X7T3Q5_9BASI|nr:hypothetical protein A4X09_0g4572 [Tilletia walkeri]